MPIDCFWDLPIVFLCTLFTYFYHFYFLWVFSSDIVKPQKNKEFLLWEGTLK